MEIGDTVRLKQPFEPELEGAKTYRYGKVVGFPGEDQSRPAVVLCLYNPTTQEHYLDAAGTLALFEFFQDEIERIEGSDL